ncbi:MAG: phospho-sugar mutase, partial [Clostridia bacterium]|nr:phospho-sugar mutase [Clostridia bacterium]
INKDAVSKVADDFKIIYTPLHGSGNIPVRKILSKIGFKNVLLVEEQLEPNGDFPTVKTPNPENKEAFDIAIEMAKKNDVDFIIGTDPDCDRVGIVLRDTKGEYTALTGNMTGALLTEYILNGRKENNSLPKDGVVIKTIVTTYMADVICKAYGVEAMNVLTGFKFIGEKIKEFEENKNHTYLFGFEESYGYLAGTHARDKDGVVATMLITEMAAWYKAKGMSLYEGLMALYEKYGVFREKAISVTLEGLDGNEKIGAIMKAVRENAPMNIGGKNVLFVSDCQSGIKKDAESGKEEKITLPKSNVILFEMEDNCWCAVRPSGTEPKIKFYMGSKGKTVEEAEETIRKIWNDLEKFTK